MAETTGDVAVRLWARIDTLIAERDRALADRDAMRAGLIKMIELRDCSLRNMAHPLGELEVVRQARALATQEKP